jgi:hypothetical protein
MLKLCGWCGEAKGRDQFSACKVRTGGLQHYCKECVRTINRAHYLRNRERILAERAVYRKDNCSVLRERERRYNAKLGPKRIIALAKMSIARTAGVPFRKIPLCLAEAKAAQLAVVRRIRKQEDAA